MYLGPRPGYLMAPRRIKRRATYEEVRRFRNSREFRTWWEEEEGRNWKINSRHPHMRGTVEYWRCAFMQGRRYTCLARLRVTIAYDDRFVIISRSRDHPHNHTRMATAEDPNVVRHAVTIEPSPMLVPEIVYIGVPRPKPPPAAAAAAKATGPAGSTAGTGPTPPAAGTKATGPAGSTAGTGPTPPEAGTKATGPTAGDASVRIGTPAGPSSSGPASVYATPRQTTASAATTTSGTQPNNQHQTTSAAASPLPAPAFASATTSSSKQTGAKP